MNEVFADAGYWIALFHPRDRHHSKALAVSQTIKGRRIVTSQAVLTEFLPISLPSGRSSDKKQCKSSRV